MHYVKFFDINGVDTKQVACIELQGAPNAATEGAVGVLGMDMTSPTHEVYRCVAVNGSVYTWELLSAGMSIISATITGEGGITKSFPYNNLKIPSSYILKKGDLILDSEGYLYQVSSIGGTSCDAAYSGTHLGGAGTRDKDYTLGVSNGKLQLVTDNGNVLSEVDFLRSDESTIYRNPTNGKARVVAIETVNGSLLRVFVGTKAEYDILSDEAKQDLFAIITDDESKDTLDTLDRKFGNLEKGLTNGTFPVAKATSLVPFFIQSSGSATLAPGAYWLWVTNGDTGALTHSLVYSNGYELQTYNVQGFTVSGTTVQMSGYNSAMVFQMAKFEE